MRLQSSIRKTHSASFSANQNYEVDFGKVISLGTTSVPGQLYDFSAGEVKLKGRDFIRDFGMMDFAAGALLTPDIAQLFDDNMDALWVYSRIMHDFKSAAISPEKQLKTALKEYHFLAIERYGDDIEAFPFVCTDYNGRSALIFSPYGPSQAIQRKISSDFWHIMLKNPADLVDYNASAVIDKMAVRFGYGDKQFYYEDQ